MALDFITKCDIERDIKRITLLLNCNIFASINSNNVLVESAFIELCILLNDLLAKTDKFSTRISFTDDVTIIPNQVEDATDLISKVRNAVCHMSSASHLLDKSNQVKASFNILYGKCLSAIQINDFKQESEYEDDVAFYFGAYRLYLYRHVIRAFNEAVGNLTPLL